MATAVLASIPAIGTPAFVADPLGNDQDWHLVMWMLLDEMGLAPIR